MLNDDIERTMYPIKSGMRVKLIIQSPITSTLQIFQIEEKHYTIILNYIGTPFIRTYRDSSSPEKLE